jgi:hypothetical protein
MVDATGDEQRIASLEWVLLAGSQYDGATLKTVEELLTGVSE